MGKYTILYFHNAGSPFLVDLRGKSLNMAKAFSDFRVRAQSRYDRKISSKSLDKDDNRRSVCSQAETRDKKSSLASSVSLASGNSISSSLCGL